MEMESLLLTFASCLIALFLVIEFFHKKRINNEETEIYSKLLVFNLFFSFFAIFAYTYGKTIGSEMGVNFTQKIYLFLIVILAHFILLYNVAIVARNTKIKKHINISLYLLLLISGILIFSSKIKVINEGEILDATGPSYDLFMIMLLLYVTLIIITSMVNFIKNRKNLKKEIPFMILITLYIIGLIVRSKFPYVVFETFFFTYSLLIMYFTIENPDVKMVDELVKNRKIIERTSEEKSIFLFKMSQELKQPISNIGREVQTYKNNKLNKSDTDVVIDNIDGNNRKMNYLITDVLGINANDNMNIKILENTYNIYSLINEIEVRTKKLLKSEIDFNFACASNIPKELYGDSLKLKQVLMSVIINSIENTSSGYIHVDVNSITKFDLCRLVISIKDSGSGIDLLTINEILDQDIEISDKEYLKLDELDVDLKIAYKIIKLLNGTMYIKSEVGKGTEVFITLNQYIKEDDEIKNNALIESYIQTRTNAKKVLVINDDIKELKKIRIKLEELGYEVYTSLFGEDAISRIKNNEKYDLILIDDDMKLMSGISLLKELNKLCNNSRKIILLEKDKVSIGHHYIEDGFDDYIDKSRLKEEIDKKI